MRALVFLTPADARHGFSLAGARQIVVSAAEAEEALRQVR